MGVQSFLTQSKGGDQRKFNANEVGSLDYYRVGGGGILLWRNSNPPNLPPPVKSGLGSLSN